MTAIDLSPWVVTGTRQVFDAAPWFKVEQDQIQMPRGRTVDDYYQIKLADYVTIFAETEDHRIIVERQYKHGPRKVTLTLPAGQVESNEPPLRAAQRELLEETGYVSDLWRPLGSFVLHGNYGCGRAHMFRASKARQVAEPDSGDLEDMEIVLMPLADLIDSVRTSEVCLMGTMATIALATHPLIQRDGEMAR